ncbi:MAG: molybdopterin-synthase adenylyltransferase MoeB [Pseudomonadota bacterium]|nr:molybdopterin-synthase adenylyltransferase MoeB [Pseudomonadota bacterium]
MSLDDSQIERYARHIVLKEVGGAGQQSLLKARVLVIGAGGLGSPLIMYLAAAGVGTIGVVDDDTVSLSNLQRQVLHDTARLGMSKTESAAESVARLNTDVRIVRHDMRIDAENAGDLVAGYDIVCDGTDNFATRFIVHDACFHQGRPLVSAAVVRFDGQLTVWRGHEAGKPCLRCLFREVPAEDTTCAVDGVLGALAGVMGALQATETIKEILGIGDSMAGQLLIYDGLAATFRKVRVRPDPACPLCADTGGKARSAA